MTRTPRASRKRRMNRAEEPMRAVIYVRLSRAKTGDSRADADRNTEVGLDTQRAGCDRVIAARGGTVVAVMQDVQSGDRLDRPGLWDAIARIKSGDANTVIVYALDRLGRDQVQQGVVIHELRRAGGTLLSATEDLQTGPLGDFMRSAATFAAAVELEKARERVNRALDAKFKTAARYKPSARPPYGYRKVGVKAATTHEIEPAEAAIVRRIFTERAGGASVRHIVDGLRADGIPSATGHGAWGTALISAILRREVYATGEHECWRTATVRDADGIPLIEDRPREDRYIAHFPPIIDPALFDRVRVVAERNVWRSRRHDRPAKYGIGRYGFFRCAGCGKALTVCGHGDTTRMLYRCGTSRSASRQPCPARASISVPLLDQPVWWWVQSVIEDPSRVDAWRVVHRPDPIDEKVVNALAVAERAVAKREAEATTLLDNLGLLSGAAARAAADRLNDLHERLDTLRKVRDELANGAAMTAAFPPVSTVEAVDALAVAVQGAIDAMHAADPNPERSHTVSVWTREGSRQFTLPDSWKAKRAALTALGVTVTLHQESADAPRWVAEMRLPGGTVIEGADNGVGGFAPDRYRDAYLFGSRR
jgi:site-specific DNA recombinase